MRHIRVNHNIKIPLIKKHYFLGLILCFPPVHELGHIVICWAIGSRVTFVDWWSHIRHIPNDLDWIHFFWEWSCLVSFALIVLWGWKNYQNIDNIYHDIVCQQNPQGFSFFIFFSLSLFSYYVVWVGVRGSIFPVEHIIRSNGCCNNFVWKKSIY